MLYFKLSDNIANTKESISRPSFHGGMLLLLTGYLITLVVKCDSRQCVFLVQPNIRQVLWLENGVSLPTVAKVHFVSMGFVGGFCVRQVFCLSLTRTTCMIILVWSPILLFPKGRKNVSFPTISVISQLSLYHKVATVSCPPLRSWVFSLYKRRISSHLNSWALPTATAHSTFHPCITTGASSVQLSCPQSFLRVTSRG